MQTPVRNWLGNVIGIILGAYITVLLVGSVVKNYDLSQQITALQNQVNQLKSQRTQLAFDIQYFQTSSYLQEEAKADLGLVEPGENEIVLPSPSPQLQAPSASRKTTPQPKLTQWWDFLLGHSQG